MNSSIRSASLVAILLGALLIHSLLAQEAKEHDPGILTLERIFADDEFKSKSFEVKWLAEGRGYTFLKEDEDESPREIWRRLPSEGEATPMVAISELTTPGGAVLKIDDYSFTDDLSLLLIYTNTKRVWRENTRGDYWILDRTSGVLRQLGGDAPPSSLMFAKLSPTGMHVAYVRDRNIYVEGLLDRSIAQLTKTESKHIINGTGDWVYEEELRLRDGFRWSPDGKAIAYWRFDQSGVRRQTMVDNVTGLYPKLQTFAYPKTGQRNSDCRVGIVAIASGETRWVNLPGDPREHYIARMDWAESSAELVCQQFNRVQNTNRIFMCAAEGEGAVEEIHNETDDAWVDAHREMFWVRDGSHFTWISDRDGWRHIYLVSRDGKKSLCLTPGEFDVVRLLTVDDANEFLYFIASPENPAERYLYRVGLDGAGLKRLTPDDRMRGTHSYDVSPDGKHAVATSSNSDNAPVSRLINLPECEEIDVLESNEELHAKVEELDRSPVEFFYVDIGEEVQLHARCIKPPDFDETKKYPLLIYVYGEPAGQVVKDRWGGKTHLWHMMLAQQGYVVMSFDNRGTAAPRGREWRKAAYRKIGILAPEDQATAVRAVLKERPYLDAERVGVWGWSGGGSMSLNAIFKFPELYQTAIAIASVPNQRYYDTIYQERYMDLPKGNVEGYREGSPINFVEQLKGDLLIVHGVADDNCHYQTFEKLVDALVRHNKPFQMMSYPRGTHAVKEGENTTLHLYSLMTRFLNRHLPPE